MASVRVPKAYKNLAEAIIEAFWHKPIEKQGRPLLSKAQIRQQIEVAVAKHQAEDGDPSTWTPCDHCDGSGIYTSVDRFNVNGTVADQERGLCFQCGGKGRQSEADRKRNWGYQAHQQETF
jgi:DnaJ-class molecular chaperone